MAKGNTISHHHRTGAAGSGDKKLNQSVRNKNISKRELDRASKAKRS
jgi:hypothetical protein